MEVMNFAFILFVSKCSQIKWVGIIFKYNKNMNEGLLEEESEPW